MLFTAFYNVTTVKWHTTYWKTRHYFSSIINENYAQWSYIR